MPARCWIVTAFIVVLLEMMLVTLLPPPSRARDTTGLSDQLSQDQREWISRLKSKTGDLCCDDADGIDPVWEMTPNGYRVFYGFEWLDVPESALITAPNKLGVARAWIGHLTSDNHYRTHVRCFLPGPAT